MSQPIRLLYLGELYAVQAVPSDGVQTTRYSRSCLFPLIVFLADSQYTDISLSTSILSEMILRMLTLFKTTREQKMKSRSLLPALAICRNNETKKNIEHTHTHKDGVRGTGQNTTTYNAKRQYQARRGWYINM